MAKSGRMLAAVLFLVALAALGWSFCHPSEPTYQGKTASTWIDLLPRPPSIYAANYTSDVRATDALVRMGTNAFPSALRMAATRDSVIKRIIVHSSWVGKCSQFLGFSKAYQRWAYASLERPRVAIEAFQLLPKQPKIAIPALVHLLQTSDNPQSRVAACRMLEHLERDGVDALPALVQVMKDPSQSVREQAGEAMLIISGSDPPDIAHPAIQADWERYQMQCADLMVPALLELMKNTNVDISPVKEAVRFLDQEIPHNGQEVRWWTTNAIKAGIWRARP